jgi:hypothetical protein
MKIKKERRVMMMKNKKWALLFCLFIGLGGVAHAVEERHEDHEALRAMLKTVTEGLNSRNLDAVGPVLSERFSITTVDQKIFTRFSDFKSYFNGLFGGDKPILKSIAFHPDADELTVFLDQNTGISYGSSQDTYNFTDGDVRVMKTRWSATVFKDKGVWKLASLHMGANIFDNPVLEALKKKLCWFAGGALLIGLILGFLIRLITGRSTRTA